ncbi:MAG: hypothetical protein Q7S17_01775 [Xanthobacteraceae bacterium]|nr:hypothetical protein [Xanthobacteraceae bacterium]
MRARNRRIRHRLTPKAALFAAALGAFGLAGCAGDVPIPFLDIALPPAPAGPPPPYPSMVAPADDPDSKPPVLNEVEQKRIEDQLKKYATDRETDVKKRIQRDKN